MALALILLSVAIIALSGTNDAVTGNVVKARDCEIETYCSEWGLVSSNNAICIEKDFIQTRLCVGYAEEDDKLVCSEWEEEFDLECVDWALETTWKKSCEKWSTRDVC